MGAEHSDGFAGLDEQSFVVTQLFEGLDDRIEGFPAAGRPAGSAVDHEVFGPFGNLWVEVVHEHAHRGFCLPAAGGDLGTAGRTDCAAGIVPGVGHRRRLSKGS